MIVICQILTEFLLPPFFFRFLLSLMTYFTLCEFFFLVGVANKQEIKTAKLNELKLHTTNNIIKYITCAKCGRIKNENVSIITKDGIFKLVIKTVAYTQTKINF